MDPVYQHFLFGCVGGLAPEVVRLYGIATQGGRARFSGFYVVTSIFFALLAGLIAAVLPSANPLAAFYAGVGTPLIINTALKKFDPAAPPTGDKGGTGGVEGTAGAESTGGRVVKNADGRTRPTAPSRYTTFTAAL
jgi:hypothetical protein